MKVVRLLGCFTAFAVSTFAANAQQQPASDTIGLDTLIHAVVSDIKRAAAPSSSGSDGTPVFDLGETQLELKFTIEKNASGKIEASFWGTGAEAEAGLKNEKIQTVILKLNPSTKVASDGSSVPSIQFSSFDPSKDSLLVSPSTYEAIKNAASVSGVTHDQPAAVDASALGVATDGFVVNREQYINWIDAVKKQDPKFEMNNALDKAVEIKIPQSKFFDK